MKKFIKKEIDLPFEVNETYKTKFATGESFKITEIRTIKRKEKDEVIGFFGTYENNPNLVNCPLDVERLIPKKSFIDTEIEVCEHCGKEK